MGRTPPPSRLIRLFEELRGVGYDGGYDAVRRYAQVWSRRRGGRTAEALVPLSFAPGKAYQFDWGHDVVLMRPLTHTAPGAGYMTREPAEEQTASER